MEQSRRLQEMMYRFPYHYTIHFDLDDYRSFSQCIDNASGFRYASYLIRAMEVIGRYDYESLIDVGCGDGFFLNLLDKKYPAKKYVGVDISDRAINFARMFHDGDQAGESGVEFLCRDILKNPMDNQFDIVTSIHVMEHIPLDILPSFVEVMSGFLQRGGKLIVSVPTKIIPLAENERHYQHFDERSLTEAVSGFFTVDVMEYLNNDKYWGRIISKCLSNRLFALKHRGLRDMFFQFYMRHLLPCSRPNGYTLLAVCTKK